MVEKINGVQFTILVIMNTLGAAIIYIPSIATRYGAENGWISIFITTLAGLGLILIYNRILSFHDKGNIFQIIDFAVGKWVGILFSFILLGYTFFNLYSNLWAIGDFLTIQILMGTPFEVITFVIIVTVVVAIVYGIEVVARTAELFFPFTMLCAFLLTVLVLKDADFERVLPIFQHQRLATVSGALPVLGITFLELVILLGITHTVNRKKTAQRGFLVGGALAGFILMTITFSSIVVLGAKGTTNATYPVYALGQRINLFDFVERIEIIVAFIWFFTIFFKMCVSFYVLALGIKHIIKLESSKSITIPIGLFTFFSATLAAPNTYAVQEFINDSLIIIAILSGFILPCILLIALLFKKKKLRE
ncbi:GerAB/ArcD/ProY family transporter [Gracilibacillus alcaliphilus]|uniref:GerAB/ArcD/ProY family transporter n=1 Tax=Gracilibacillus alcaliphilus TaxID=1401441 RepID=UPI0019562105|nr:endospore germination permease [Gracilibacillus alcaliphilus]MBM7676544.1 spore germination protein KB [Gracilibacillus alcaliphilus]